MNQRLEMLRAVMREYQVDYYLIPTEDFHGSEYVGEYFGCRRFITGFTGSAGTAVIDQEGAGLWTDGRYFLQAAKQLEDSGVTLFRMGEEGVPTIAEFLEQNLKPGQCAACDGRTISGTYARELQRIAEKKQAVFRSCDDLTGKIWTDRPSLSCAPIWLPDENYVGVCREEKLERVRAFLKEKGADIMVLSSLDEIAWLFNIRGGDVACCPLVLSYAVIGRKEAFLYVQEKACSESFYRAMDSCGVRIKSYASIYEELSELAEDQVVWADPGRVNMALCDLLKSAKSVVEDTSPIPLMKAVKNEKELEGFSRAHLYDGAAVTRFLFWLKTHVGKESITEISAARKLEEFRKECSSYLMPSFEPIMGYQEHGAIVHYSATKETDKQIKAEGILLSDTGGHYQEGTTDITRAIVLGPLTDIQKEHYTRVLKGNLALAAAKFPKGCSGESLDAIARMPLWEAQLDYNHGTGHGVGHILNVHEGPQVIRWGYRKGNHPTALQDGMVISDEPGLYLESEYGIRLENLIVCRDLGSNKFQHFMGFEVLTLVPFEREAIKPELLNEEERNALNDYHERVCTEIMPFMKTQEEKDWLAEVTRAI